MKTISRAEAKAAGLTRYFTGTSCNNGHVCERTVRADRCVECRKGALKRWRKAYPEKNNANGRAYWAKTRAACINALGGKCACCGETEIHFLAVDHTHGGGNAHRRSIGIREGSGGRLHLWVLREIKRIGLRAVKKDFRVLCFNCNQAFFSLGYCPHKVPS